MLTTNMDATILLEQPSDIEEIDGLFYVTDRVGTLIIRRCFRPSTFFKGQRRADEVARAFVAKHRGIVDLHGGTDEADRTSEAGRAVDDDRAASNGH